jgi:alpha-N-acetylglucosamine transferase
MKAKKYSYVTILSDNYLKGALALNQSIKDHCNYPLLVLCYNTTEKTRKLLEENGVQYKMVNMITSPLESEKYRGVYTKLMVFNLLEYDLVVFIDSDTIILKSPDDIFQKDSELRSTRMLGATALHGNELKDDEFSPGFMVIKPSAEVFADLMAKKDNTPTYDGGDQGFLNKYFFNNWYRIPDEYHVTKRIFKHHQAKWYEMLGNIRILHFPGAKPWNIEPRIPFEQGYEKLEEIWQKVYNKVEHKCDG